MIYKYVKVAFKDRSIEHLEGDFHNDMHFLVKLNEWNARGSGMWQYWSEDRIDGSEIQGRLDTLEDWENTYTSVMNSSCEDEKHCTCVPFLRREIERLKVRALM